MTILVWHSIDLGAFRQAKRVQASIHLQIDIGKILSIFMFLLVDVSMSILA